MSSYIADEEIYTELVDAALKDVAGFTMPGSHFALALAPHVSRALIAVLNRHGMLDQQGMMDALSRIPVRRAVEIARQKAAEADLDEAQRAALVQYLAAVPVTSRQVLHRWGALGQLSNLLDRLPGTAERMARLMPAWRPAIPVAAGKAARGLIAAILAWLHGLVLRRPPVAPPPQLTDRRRLR